MVDAAVPQCADFRLIETVCPRGILRLMTSNRANTAAVPKAIGCRKPTSRSIPALWAHRSCRVTLLVCYSQGAGSGVTAFRLAVEDLLAIASSAFEPSRAGGPSFRAFCERVGSTDVNFNEKAGCIGPMLPPLQRTQGWGTLFRGGPTERKMGGLAHPLGPVNTWACWTPTD